jgi:hypothetical protein
MLLSTLNRGTTVTIGILLLNCIVVLEQGMVFKVDYDDHDALRLGVGWIQVTYSFSLVGDDDGNVCRKGVGQFLSFVVHSCTLLS